MEQEEQQEEEQVEDQEEVEVPEDVEVTLRPAMVRVKSNLARQSPSQLFPTSRLEYVLFVERVHHADLQLVTTNAAKRFAELTTIHPRLMQNIPFETCSEVYTARL